MESFPPEESLDPEDWQAMRKLGHRMVDDMLDYLEHIRDRPVWQPIPQDVKDRFKTPAPFAPEGAERPYQEFLDYVLPYSLGNTHPRFWGWVMGPGTVMGMFADLLVSAINSNGGALEHIPNYIEAQVLGWCKTIVGFPESASGLIVTGGSMGNLIGLTVARYANAGFDVRREGLAGAPHKPVVYASAEAHSSNQKSIELLGLGSDAYRQIPVNSVFQMDVDALERAIAEDREVGHRPLCVIGACGTTNTGSIDDLNRLADICAREGIWLHVDGAFGALAALSPALHGRVAGLERADSVAFDLHKWGYLPFEIGVVLVRNAEHHLRTFTLTPAYLAHHGERGAGAGDYWFSEYSFETTRRSRGLKAWMGFKEHGFDKLRRLIEQNVEQARYLEALIDAEPNLENVSPVALNVVNFRFYASGLDDQALNRLNEELLIRLQESGAAVPSGTVLNGKAVIHVAITNHRSRRDDFDLLVHECRRIGRELLESGWH